MLVWYLKQGCQHFHAQYRSNPTVVGAEIKPLTFDPLTFWSVGGQASNCTTSPP
jgi:hypothetical protein